MTKMLEFILLPYNRYIDKLDEEILTLKVDSFSGA